MNANVNPNEDTEFHDELRKRGIIPPKPPSRSPSPELPTAAERRQTQLDRATLEDIDAELEGEKGDEEERILLRLRQERMNALAKERRRGRFGRVYPIARPDYTREVTEASKVDVDADAESDGEEEEVVETGAGSFTAATADQEQKPKNGKERRGTGVVCFLYKDSIEECRLLSGYLDTLSAKYPSTKFVSIIGDQCIPNYPDRNLPTLLIYRNGDLHRQIIGLRPEIGLDGMKTKCEDIELLLTAVGVVDRSTIPGSTQNTDAPNDSSQAATNARRKEEHTQMEDEDEGFGGSNRKYTRPSVRSQDDEDAELDWDL